MIAFGWVTNMLQRGMASWKRMLEVLDTEPAIADAGRRVADTQDCRSAAVRESAFERLRIRGEIEFRDLVVRLQRHAGPEPRLRARSRRDRPSRSSA